MNVPSFPGLVGLSVAGAKPLGPGGPVVGSAKGDANLVRLLAAFFHHVYGWYKPSTMGLLIFCFNHIKFVYLKLLLWYDVFVSLFLCLIVCRFAYLVVLFLAIAVFFSGQLSSLAAMGASQVALSSVLIESLGPEVPHQQDDTRKVGKPSKYVKII